MKSKNIQNTDNKNTKNIDTLETIVKNTESENIENAENKNIESNAENANEQKVANIVKTPKNQKLKIFKTLQVVFVTIFIAFFASISLTFGYAQIFLEVYPIIGTSMQPTINFNDRYNIDNSFNDYVFLNTKTKDFNHGDILIIKSSHSSDTNVIKRLIATSGDNIMIDKSTKHFDENNNSYYSIFVQYGGKGNFIELEEPYTSSYANNNFLYVDFYTPSPSKNFVTLDGKTYLTISEGCIFYLGDNRINSNDCGDYGEEQIKNVVGKVMAIVQHNKLHSLSVVFQLWGNRKWSY